MNNLELRQVLENSGLTKDDFANKLRKSPHTLNSWLYGKREIPDSVAVLIEHTFGTNDQENVPDNEEKTVKVLNISEEELLSSIKNVIDNWEQVNERTTFFQDEAIMLAMRAIINWKDNPDIYERWKQNKWNFNKWARGEEQ